MTTDHPSTTLTINSNHNNHNHEGPTTMKKIKSILLGLIMSAGRTGVTV